jgi:hypothetical protein
MPELNSQKINKRDRGGIPHSTKPTLAYYPIPGEDRWVKLSIIAVL